MRPGACEVLAFSQWADLQALTDLRRLDDEVQARLMRPESRKFTIGPVTAHDRVGESPGDRPGPGLRPLWRPPVGARETSPTTTTDARTE
jgi:hypothetical protein